MAHPEPIFQANDDRLSYGISSRLPRSSPTEVMKFHEWEIPPGVSLLKCDLIPVIPIHEY